MKRSGDNKHFTNDIDDDEGIELLADDETSTSSPDIIEGIDVDKLANRSTLEDFIDAFHQAKYPLLVTIAILAVVCYQLTIGQYQFSPSSGDVPVKHTWDTLKFIRPVLSARKQYIVNENTLFGETTLQLPNNDAISFKFDPSSDKYGSFQLPELFYQGVCFSIGLGNSHDVDYASTKQFTMGELFQRLSALTPRPMYIAPRVTERSGAIPVQEPELFTDDWSESGFLVYYSYKQLDEQGLLSSQTPTQPWKRVSDALLEVAREFKQMYVTVYYANAFGPSDTNQAYKLGERNRQRRLLADSDPSVERLAYDLPLPNEHEEEQKNVYHLSRGYGGEFTHSVDQRDVTLIEDEVVHYKRENPKGPRITPRDARPSSTFPKIHRHLLDQEGKPQGEEGRTRLRSTSVMGFVKNDYLENGRPLTQEELQRRAAESMDGDTVTHADAVRDSHNHKYETIIQEVLPAFTGLDKIKSKSAIWLSRINHAQPSEVILDTFETLSFDKPATRRTSSSPAASLLGGVQEHRRLLRDDETEVSLPHSVNGTDVNREEVDYFDYLMSSKGYNHVNKLESFNVVYSKAWQRKSFASEAESYTSFGKQAKHWSEYVPYGDAVKYAKKYSLPIDEIEL